MKKWWVIAGVVLIFAVAFYIIISTIPINKTLSYGENGTRFVDTITKVTDNWNKNEIQKSLDNTSYSTIIVELNEKTDANSVIQTLSQGEFQVIHVSILRPIIITANATMPAIAKLDVNPNVTRIFFAAPGGGPVLQDSVP